MALERIPGRKISYKIEEPSLWEHVAAVASDPQPEDEQWSVTCSDEFRLDLWNFLALITS
jgi:hypothetical protein